MNRLQIRLGGPYFTAFLVNRITIDLQNRPKSALAQPNFRFDSHKPDRLLEPEISLGDLLSPQQGDQAATREVGAEGDRNLPAMAGKQDQ